MNQNPFGGQNPFPGGEPWEELLKRLLGLQKNRQKPAGGRQGSAGQENPFGQGSPFSQGNPSGQGSSSGREKEPERFDSSGRPVRKKHRFFKEMCIRDRDITGQNRKVHERVLYGQEHLRSRY